MSVHQTSRDQDGRIADLERGDHNSISYDFNKEERQGENIDDTDTGPSPIDTATWDLDWQIEDLEEDIFSENSEECLLPEDFDLALDLPDNFSASQDKTEAIEELNQDIATSQRMEPQLPSDQTQTSSRTTNEPVEDLVSSVIPSVAEQANPLNGNEDSVPSNRKVIVPDEMGTAVHDYRHNEAHARLGRAVTYEKEQQNRVEQCQKELEDSEELHALAIKQWQQATWAYCFMSCAFVEPFRRHQQALQAHQEARRDYENVIRSLQPPVGCTAHHDSQSGCKRPRDATNDSSDFMCLRRRVDISHPGVVVPTKAAPGGHHLNAESNSTNSAYYNSAYRALRTGQNLQHAENVTRAYMPHLSTGYCAQWYLTRWEWHARSEKKRLSQQLESARKLLDVARANIAMARDDLTRYHNVLF